MRKYILLTLWLVSQTAIATPPNPRLMIIGDSIQAGTNLQNVTHQASYELQRRSGFIVHNFSSPGATMADLFYPGMHNATESVILLYGYFRMYGLIINIGVNDWGNSIALSKFSSAYGAFLDSIPQDIHVLCVSPTWNTGEGTVTNGYTLAQFRSATQAVCTSRGRSYVDGLTIIPNSSFYFDPDGLHPNDRGHKLMGSNLARAIAQLGWHY